MLPLDRGGKELCASAVKAGCRAKLPLIAIYWQRAEDTVEGSDVLAERESGDLVPEEELNKQRCRHIEGEKFQAAHQSAGRLFAHLTGGHLKLISVLVTMEIKAIKQRQ